MAALERDLERVLADQAHVLNSQLLGGEVLDARETAGSAGFAATLGARARPSELLTRVGAPVLVLPSDLHDLTVAVDVDAEGKRVWVFQLSRPGTLTDVDYGQLAVGLDGGAGGDL